MSQQSTPSRRGKRKSSRFSIISFLTFTVLVLFGNAPLWFFPDCILPFQKLMVKVVGWLISISGLQITQNGIYIILKNNQWIMTPECTAISAIIVFSSFIFAYRSSLRSKTLAIVIGIPFIIVANILRLFTLAWATELFPKYANLAHDYVWQVAFLILIVIMWLVWIEMVVNRENKTTVSC